MFEECTGEASKLRELSPKELSKIVELVSIGIFEAGESELRSVQRKIYQISKGKIKKCFFGDGCLFAIFKTGYIGDLKSYLLKSFNQEDYKNRAVLRPSFLTHD